MKSGLHFLCFFVCLLSRKESPEGHRTLPRSKGICQVVRQGSRRTSSRLACVEPGTGQTNASLHQVDARVPCHKPRLGFGSRDGRGPGTLSTVKLRRTGALSHQNNNCAVLSENTRSAESKRRVERLRSLQCLPLTLDETTAEVASSVQPISTTGLGQCGF